MERELSSFDIYLIVHELQDLIGSYINKIYQLSKNEILIRIKTKNQKNTLYIKNEHLICTTTKKFPTPTTPSTFAMTLRKYLINGTIQAIAQHEFDRIITFTIKNKGDIFTLVIELFKKGNILLVNSDNIIILPLLTQRWAHRTLKPHQTYTPPPSQQNPFTLTHDAFTRALQTSTKDVVRTLAATINLGGTYAEELCLRANITKQTPTDTLDEAARDTIYATFVSFLDLFRTNQFQPLLIKKQGKPIDIVPFPFHLYKSYETEELDRFSRGLEQFISEQPQVITSTSSQSKEKLNKLQRQLVQQQQSIDEFKKKIKQKKKEGDLIYLHFHQCQALLDEITQLLKMKDKEDLVAEINKKPYVKHFAPEANELEVIFLDKNDEPVELSLDFRKTVAENANKAYQERKKLKEKVDGAKTAIKTTKELIAKQQKTIRTEQATSQPAKDEGKRFWFERYRWCLSSAGNIIVAGRDAKSNEQVVKKYLTKGDRYVHADIHGAPSCIVKNVDIHNTSTPISDATLQETCVFAACYSKAWKQFGEAQVYWVLPEQVSKTPQTGEFLPKGAFIIRGKRNYSRCKLTAAIGKIQLGDRQIIMGGSIASVQARSDHYVIIEPGDTKASLLAHTIAEVFHVSPDDILRVLPPGESQIVKTKGITLAEEK